MVTVDPRRAISAALPCFLAAVALFTAGADVGDRPAGEGSAGTLKVVIAHGPGEQPLRQFQEYLEKNYRVTCTWLRADKGKAFDDLEALTDCDVILTNLYRTQATPEQLEQLQKCFRSKPVVGMRRAHHGFQNWLEADLDVFGVDYRGHYFGRNLTLRLVDKHKDNPMFRGMDTGKLPDGGLYQHLEAADDVDVYMIGGPEDKPPMPQTWSRINERRGQRVFYTRYGPNDLGDESVRNMVIKALFWAAQRDPNKMKRSR